MGIIVILILELHIFLLGKIPVLPLVYDKLGTF